MSQKNNTRNVIAGKIFQDGKNFTVRIKKLM